MNRFTIALFLFAIQASPAFSVENCSDVEDSAARLECFDRNFPSVGNPAPISPQVTEQTESVADDVRPDETLDSSPRDEPILEEAVVVIESEKPASQEKKAEGSWKNLFSIGSDNEISGTIVDLLKKDKQPMVFKLDNDQIWIQTKARNVRIRKGDNVTIRSATFGGFIMYSESGASTRVSLIENE
ncbi:MAG: hypothetical protein VB957_18440 [Pseudomonadales bacterium]|jgi:hypothetical protein